MKTFQRKRLSILMSRSLSRFNRPTKKKSERLILAITNWKSRQFTISRASSLPIEVMGLKLRNDPTKKIRVKFLFLESFIIKLHHYQDFTAENITNHYKLFVFMSKSFKTDLCFSQQINYLNFHQLYSYASFKDLSDYKQFQAILLRFYCDFKQFWAILGDFHAILGDFWAVLSIFA